MHRPPGLISISRQPQIVAIITSKREIQVCAWDLLRVGGPGFWTSLLHAKGSGARYKGVRPNISAHSWAVEGYIWDPAGAVAAVVVVVHLPCHMPGNIDTRAPFGFFVS